MNAVFASKYSIVEKLDAPVGEFEYVILNSFSGSIDALSQRVLNIYNSLLTGKRGRAASQDEYVDYFVRRGYFYRERDGEARKVSALKQASDKVGRSTARPRLVVLTTYDCNLNCTYCYQRSMRRSARSIAPDKLDRVFGYIDGLPKAARRKLTIDVIGGEPLLDKEPNRSGIVKLVAECEKRGVHFRIISNGVYLTEFLDVLSGARTLDFVQVTIDGPPGVQMRRRPKRRDSYVEELRKGVSAALDKGIRIAARTNIDTRNVTDLKALADWYDELGWTGRSGFYAYVSPVHDHLCGSCSSAFDECRILNRLLEYEDAHPDVVSRFSRSNFLAYQYLKNPLADRSFTSPRYYRCEANTNQLVFDPEGLLYACIEAAGHREHSIGRYSPEFALDDRRLRMWRGDRNIVELKSCKECEICFICGGNCAWGAFNAQGESDGTQCRALRESVRLLLRKRGHLLISNQHGQGPQGGSRPRRAENSDA